MQRNIYDELDPVQQSGVIYSGTPTNADIPQRTADRQDDEFVYRQGQDAVGNENERVRIGLAAQDNALAADRLGMDKDAAPKDRAEALRKEFASKPSVAKYDESLGGLYVGLNSKPTPQGDYTLITAYAKMQDPTTGVLGGEFDNVSRTEGYTDSQIALLEKNFGFTGGLLSPKGRERMRGEMITITNRRKEAYNRDRKDFQEYAQRYGLDPFEVVGSHLGDAYRDEFKDYDARNKKEQEQLVGVTTGERMDMETTEDDNRYYFQRANGLTYDQEVAFSDWLNSNVGRPLTAEQIDAKKAELEIPPTAKLKDSGAIAQEHMTVGVPDANGAVRTANWGRRSLEGAREAAIAEKNRELAAQEQALADGGYAASQEAQRNADAFDRGGLEGVSLNYADDIVGAFNQNAGREMRLSSDVYDETAGGYKIAGEIGGSMLLPFKGGGAGKVAAQAAAYGAASGVGRGETMGERLAGGALGAATGAVGGYAVQKGIDKLAPAIAPKLQQGMDWAASKFSRAESPNIDVYNAATDLNLPIMAPDVGGPMTKRIGAALEQSPFAVGQMKAGGNRFVEAAAKRKDELVRTIAEPLRGEKLGARVREGAKTAIANARAKKNGLYSTAERMAGDTPVRPVKAFETVAGIIDEINAASGTSPALPILKRLQARFANTENRLTVPAARNIRSELRDELQANGLAWTNTERRVMNVMDSLSDDIDDSLTRNGMADAAQAYRAADIENTAYRDLVDNIISPIIGKKKDANGLNSPDQIVQKLNTALKTDERQIGRLIQALPADDAAVVRASLMDTLGRPTASNLTAEGEGFSLAKFLTHWNEIEPSTRLMVFGEELTPQLAKLAKVSEGAKATQAYANTSNTAGGLWGANPLGNTFKATAVAWPIAENVTARLMASPKFVKWLAGAQTMPNPNAARAYIERLSGVAKAEPAIANNVIDFQKVLADTLSQSPKRAAAEEEQNGRQIPPNQAKLYDESQDTQGGRIQ